jgi:antitoxin VapB
MTGRSQAIRIPKQFRFDCDEVFIEQEGQRVVLTPRPRSWREYFARAPSLTDDFPDDVQDQLAEGRES